MTIGMKPGGETEATLAMVLRRQSHAMRSDGRNRLTFGRFDTVNSFMECGDCPDTTPSTRSGPCRATGTCDN